MLRSKGTSITRFIDVGIADVSPMTKWIKFTDVGVGEGTLDQYLLGRYMPAAGASGSRTGKFRPVGTSDNEVCMFPASASIRLCTIVASLFSKSLTTYTFDSTPLIRPYLLNRNDREGENPEETEAIAAAAPILDRRKSVGRRESTPGRPLSGAARQKVPQTSEANIRAPLNYAEVQTKPAASARQRRSLSIGKHVRRER